MVKERRIADIVYLDSARLVVVGEHRAVRRDAEYNATRIYVVDDLLSDG